MGRRPGGGGARGGEIVYEPSWFYLSPGFLEDLQGVVFSPVYHDGPAPSKQEVGRTKPQTIVVRRNFSL